MQNEISHEGIVLEVDGEELLVEMTVSSACASCHAKSACTSSDAQKRVVRAVPLADVHYSVGDKVRVIMRASSGHLAVFLAYVVPLLLLFATLFLTNHFLGNELLSVAFSIVVLAFYFVGLKFLSKSFTKEFVFYAQKD